MENKNLFKSNTALKCGKDQNIINATAIIKWDLELKPNNESLKEITQFLKCKISSEIDQYGNSFFMSNNSSLVDKTDYCIQFKSRSEPSLKDLQVYETLEYPKSNEFMNGEFWVHLNQISETESNRLKNLIMFNGYKTEEKPYGVLNVLKPFQIKEISASLLEWKYEVMAEKTVCFDVQSSSKSSLEVSA